MKINNLSSSFDWEIDHLNQNQSEIYEEEIPTSYMLGISYNIPYKLLVSTQIDSYTIKSNTNLSEIFYYKYKLGFEYHLDSKITNNTIFLRFGLNNLNNDYKCALGFGMPFEINDSMILNVDYALDPGLVNEGISHLFSFSLLNYYNVN